MNRTFDGKSRYDVEMLNLTGETDMPVSESGKARIYFDSESQTIKVSLDGGAFLDVLTGGNVQSYLQLDQTTPQTITAFDGLGVQFKYLDLAPDYGYKIPSLYATNNNELDLPQVGLGISEAMIIHSESGDPSLILMSGGLLDNHASIIKHSLENDRIEVQVSGQDARFIVKNATIGETVYPVIGGLNSAASSRLMIENSLLIYGNTTNPTVLLYDAGSGQFGTMSYDVANSKFNFSGKAIFAELTSTNDVSEVASYSRGLIGAADVGCTVRSVFKSIRTSGLFGASFSIGAIDGVVTNVGATTYSGVLDFYTCAAGAGLAKALRIDELQNSIFYGGVTAKQYNSNVATGTSPFSCVSTTLNTNLNADLWDGYQFADYLNQAVKTTSNVSFGTIRASGAITVTRTSLASTSTDGLVLQNTTDATSGARTQISPRLRFHGEIWDTTTGSNETHDIKVELIPVSVATPYSYLLFSNSIDGGTYSSFFTVGKNSLSFGDLSPVATVSFAKALSPSTSSRFCDIRPTFTPTQNISSALGVSLSATVQGNYKCDYVTGGLFYATQYSTADSVEVCGGAFYGEVGASGEVETTIGGLFGVEINGSMSGNYNCTTTNAICGQFTVSLFDSFDGTGKGIVTNAYGCYVVSAYKETNSLLTNMYGLYIEDQTTASALNYAIYTNAGLVHFGDDVEMAVGATVDGIDLSDIPTDYFAVDQTTPQTITFDADTEMQFEVTSVSFAGITLKIPTINATSYSSDMETIPFDKGIGVRRGLFLIDPDGGGASLLFVESDNGELTAAGSISADFENGWFESDWSWYPSEDNMYDLGDPSQAWRNADQKGYHKSCGHRYNVVRVTGDYTVTTNDDVIISDTSGNNTVTLFPATGSGSKVDIAQVNTGVVTIEGDGSDTIDGNANKSIAVRMTSYTLCDYETGKWKIL